jgi:predicted SAM-dependent methyltransferase
MQKLELGCGDKPTPGYLHQDIIKRDILLDFVCNPWEIKLPEGALSQVIALGVIEHMRFEEVRMTLKHMNLLLVKNGEFLFDVPDMTIWSEYLHNMLHGMSEKNPFSDYHVWNTFYGWQRWPGDEHKSGWTKNSITKEINDANYSKIEEGSVIFTSIGIFRDRFIRKGDAHLYIKAIK